MARTESTAVGERRAEKPFTVRYWESAFSYSGTRDELLSTGLFRSEWFPGEPGKGQRYATTSIGARSVQIHRRANGRFEARWYFTDAEMDAMTRRRELFQATTGHADAQCDAEFMHPRMIAACECGARGPHIATSDC